ncbi:FecR family protein [Sphingobacterium sp. MYb382]|uniref:FecR family protein n=1 Tax=Sphingobacterium sp. MYb382 TaxID=2745278 RepID=UPI0030AF06A7
MDKQTLHHFFNGSCSEQDKALIRDWLEADSANWTVLQQERRLFDLLLLTKNEEQQEKRVPKIQPLTFWRWAAAILTIGLAGLSWYTLNKEPIQEPQQWTTIKAPFGSRVQIILPDSSLAWLNAGSTMSYPGAFEKNKRQVTLDGEAYFEVKPNTNRKFNVETSYGNVEVLGTKFNVDAPSGCNNFKTSLMEGKVQINNHAGKTMSVILAPGQLAELKNGELVVRSIKDYSVYDWRKGIISFNDISMEKLAHIVKKYYDIELVITNTALKTHRYSGKFRMSDGIEQVMRVLQRYENFKERKIVNSKKIELM